MAIAIEVRSPLPDTGSGEVCFTNTPWVAHYYFCGDMMCLSRCRRPWYKNATLSTDPTQVVFNGVDADAGTGNAYIGLSKAVRVGTGSGSQSLQGELKAVVAVDLDVSAMYHSLDSVRKRSDGSAWSGYAFVVDGNGYVALHPATMSGGSKVSQIDDAEFGARPDSAEKRYFSSQIKPMLMNNSLQTTTPSASEDSQDGLVRYQKNGEEWVLAFSPVQPGGYTLCLTVSMKDLSKPADDLQASSLPSPR